MVKLVLDTNLLILYLLGSYRPDMINSCNYTSKYNKDDFTLLKTYINMQSAIHITPHILAELSNQSFFLKEPGLSEYFEIIIAKLNKMNDDYISLPDLLKNTDLLPKIGFTDVSIYELAKKQNYVVLTDDFSLHQILSSRGLNTLSFAHIQGGVWDI
ncbi:MAG: hypothetical protein Q7R31_01645 [Candidatus Levybacteria bacterium]|nr:hypothetical protein [Candidatus Levybacteria bacterium]